MGVESISKPFEKPLRDIFKRKEVLNEDVDILHQFCEMVFYRYFNSYYTLKEDLIQEGIKGILYLVYEDIYDENRSPINLVFTKVRNNMGNFLYKERDVNLSEGENEDSISHNFSLINYITQYDEVVQKVEDFLKEQFKILELDGKLENALEVYFKDKFGLYREVVDGYEVDNYFVNRYNYYINYIEYKFFNYFLDGNIFNNYIKDICKVMALENDDYSKIDFLIHSLDEETLKKVIYVFSDTNFKFPDKNKVFNIDIYLEMTKMMEYSRMSAKQVADIYGKPVSFVENVHNKYKYYLNKLGYEDRLE